MTLINTPSEPGKTAKTPEITLFTGVWDHAGGDDDLRLRRTGE
jgi:hypothetical protein